MHIKLHGQEISITTEELMKIIPWSGFSNRRIVANKSDLPKIYETGTGKIKLRGKLEFEKGKGREKDKKLLRKFHTQWLVQESVNLFQM